MRRRGRCVGERGVGVAPAAGAQRDPDDGDHGESDEDDDDRHASASRNTSDRRRRANTNSVTRPRPWPPAARHRCRPRRRARAAPRRRRPRRSSTPARPRAHDAVAVALARAPPGAVGRSSARSSTRPATTRRPWSMMATDSHRSSTWSSWWLENRTQHPARACSTSTWPMASIPLGSSPASGSSRTSSSGPCRRAAASCTRCWFPCESSSTLSSARSAMPRRSSHPWPAWRASAGCHAVQPSEVLELLADLHGGVQAALLGHVPEAAPLGLPTGSPFQRTVAAVEVGEAEHGPHGGRLAGAVRTEESHHLPARHGEGQIVECGERAETPAQPFELEEAGHRRTLSLGDALRGAGFRAPPRGSRRPSSSASTPACPLPR